MRQPASAQRDSFVADGLRMYAATPVKTWHESGLAFEKLQKRGRTRQVVLHWTGAENAPVDVHKNLSAKRCSVHFVIDQYGLAWQMADTALACAHAAGVNDRSIGIEIVNPGDAPPDVPDKGFERPVVEERIHGKLVRYRDFLMEQTLAAIGLVWSLCRAYQIPMRVPTHPAGGVRAGVLTEVELEAFTGAIAHFHTKPTKRDCGIKLLRLIHAHGGGQVL